jgi:hypothetical protein
MICGAKGCRRLHHTLLHEALQGEEVTVLVVVKKRASRESESSGDEEGMKEGRPPAEEDPPEEDSVSQGSWEDDEPRLCRQVISLEVGGAIRRLQVMYDWGATVTLIRSEAAQEAH